MTNEDIDDWALHAYTDNELSPEQRADVEALLARDPAAARKVESWRRQRELLKGAFDGLLTEPAPPQLAATLRRPTVRSMRPWFAAAAALLLLLMGGLSGWFLKGETEPAVMAGLASQALEAHAVYAVEVRHPVEVAASEKDHLQAWLSKRVGNPFPVPDLSSEGYTLLGGRLLAEASGPSAMLMYEDAHGGRLSVLVAPSGTEGETALHVEERGKLIACTWTDGKLAIAIAGEMAYDPMMKLAKVVYDKFEG
ncbi:anti-sigma factor family protein [Aestuariivirga sp.]|uniref:anti-sigma factor family protein n=1 Tax=Aestuariivirga sp. TaxID=2650926 RepID=UPI003BAA5B74